MQFRVNIGFADWSAADACRTGGVYPGACGQRCVAAWHRAGSWDRIRLSNGLGRRDDRRLYSSLFGFFLTAIGYDGLKEVQEASTIAGIDHFFKYMPIAAYVILFMITYFFDLEKKLPDIQKELAQRTVASK